MKQDKQTSNLEKLFIFLPTKHQLKFLTAQSYAFEFNEMGNRQGEMKGKRKSFERKLANAMKLTVKKKVIRSYQESVEYSKSLPLVEKTINATSASQSTEISWAFFNNPDLRFENVTCLLILFSILFS